MMKDERMGNSAFKNSKQLPVCYMMKDKYGTFSLQDQIDKDGKFRLKKLITVTGLITIMMKFL